ncbi:hypothetical protein [Paracoccus seriniphilus]|uniref:hypothetical protein n=2 Tax=Paracoccus seriniphilus TaxID=184748 RepID=UPI000B782132|nr:hypothetical protein [Paracoccus seriniphilus]
MPSAGAIMDDAGPAGIVMQRQGSGLPAIHDMFKFTMDPIKNIVWKSLLRWDISAAVAPI